MLRCSYFFAVCIAALLLFAPVRLKAQQVNIKGITLKAKSIDRLAEVTVTNSKTKAMTMSDLYGVFTIPASIGDTLVFSRLDYTVFKQAVPGSNDLIIYLEPTVMLNTVIIKGHSLKQEQNDVMAAYRSKGVYNNGKSSVLSSIASPLNGLYDAFGKAPRQARRFNDYMKEENKAVQINKRFTRTLVEQITAMQDDDLTAFMDTYRPDYDDIIKWTDYELIDYIKRSAASYNSFKKDKPAPAPVLKAPSDS